jgi:two-component system response regulator
MRRFPRMLVADDDENDLRMIARALPMDEPVYPVTFVHDGGEALDFLYGRGAFAQAVPERPGVLLLDLHMPRCNGWDVLREARRDERLRQLPIVIFSSSDREHDMRSCYDLGATAYVMKPVDTTAFRQTVAKIHAFWIGCNRLAGSAPLPSPPTHAPHPAAPGRPSGRYKAATP